MSPGEETTARHEESFADRSAGGHMAGVGIRSKVIGLEQSVL